jgi:hypothetical protein
MSTVDMKSALKMTALSVAKREGWRNPSVRVTPGRKTNKFSVGIAFTGDDKTGDVEAILGRAFDALRAAQCAEAQAQWPTITVKSLVFLGAKATSCTEVRF